MINNCWQVNKMLWYQGNQIFVTTRIVLESVPPKMSAKLFCTELLLLMMTRILSPLQRWNAPSLWPEMSVFWEASSGVSVSWKLKSMTELWMSSQTRLMNLICRATSHASARGAQLFSGSLEETLYTSALMNLRSETLWRRAVNSILYQPSLMISMYSDGDGDAGWQCNECYNKQDVRCYCYQQMCVGGGVRLWLSTIIERKNLILSTNIAVGRNVASGHGKTWGE